MSVKGHTYVRIDRNVWSKYKTHGVTSLVIYWHGCNIILKRLHGST